MGGWVRAHTIAGLWRMSPIIRNQPAREGDIRVSLGDARLATAQLKWSARTSLTTGLVDMMHERWLVTPAPPSPAASSARPV